MVNNKPDFEDYAAKWMENDLEEINLFADFLYVEGTDLSKEEKQYKWRVNVSPENVGEETYSEIIGDTVRMREGNVQNPDNALDGRDRARDRLDEIENYLSEKGFKVYVDEHSFEEPEFEFP